MELENDKTFYTETMAKLLVRQGRYERAATVYRFLAEKHPHRADLEAALENVVSLIPKGAETWMTASGLINRWVTLILRYKTLRQLKRFTIPQAGDRRPGE